MSISEDERKRQIEYALSLRDEDIDTSDPDAHLLREDQLASMRPLRDVLAERKKRRAEQHS